MIISLFILLSVGVVMTTMTIIGTFAKNDWGINLDPILCPNCGAILSKVRKPKSLRQVLWGGGTCGVCGTEIDKWGRRIGIPSDKPTSMK